MSSHIKERPILFSGEMVRAILEGRKTQTRRVVKPQPAHVENDFEEYWLWRGEKLKWLVDCGPFALNQKLWVKETFSPWADNFTKAVCQSKDKAVYRADYRKGCPSLEVGGCENWKPSIFMPHWASRITLEITSVRVDRLQKISEQDAVAEGIALSRPHFPASDPYKNRWKNYSNGAFNLNPLESYKSLWESINGNGSWEKNPWVWVIEFKKT